MAGPGGENRTLDGRTRYTALSRERERGRRAMVARLRAEWVARLGATVAGRREAPAHRRHRDSGGALRIQEVQIEPDSLGYEAVVHSETGERLMCGLNRGVGRFWAEDRGFEIVRLGLPDD